MKWWHRKANDLHWYPLHVSQSKIRQYLTMLFNVSSDSLGHTPHLKYDNPHDTKVHSHLVRWTRPPPNKWMAKSHQILVRIKHCPEIGWYLYVRDITNGIQTMIFGICQYMRRVQARQIFFTWCSFSANDGNKYFYFLYDELNVWCNSWVGCICLVDTDCVSAMTFFSLKSATW